MTKSNTPTSTDDIIRANYEAMDTYIDEIVKAAGLDTMNPTYTAQFKEQLVGQVQQRIGMGLMESLDEKSLEAYVDIFEQTDNPDPDKAAKFFQEHVPNYEQIVKKELEDFSKEFIGNAQELRKTAEGGTGDDFSEE